MNNKTAQVPELVALCQEDEDGEEQIAGWAMVFADRVVGYVPDPTGVWDSSYTFPSLDSAKCILGYARIYPVTNLTTLPDDPPAPR
jgi:hypothetical protein